MFVLRRALPVGLPNASSAIASEASGRAHRVDRGDRRALSASRRLLEIFGRGARTRTRGPPDCETVDCRTGARARPGADNGLRSLQNGQQHAACSHLAAFASVATAKVIASQLDASAANGLIAEVQSIREQLGRDVAASPSGACLDACEVCS